MKTSSHQTPPPKARQFPLPSRESLKRPIVAVLLIASLSRLPAHPGHNPGEVSPAHLLQSPDHLGFALLVAVILFLVARVVLSRFTTR